MGYWVVEVPIRLSRSGNLREHWRKTYERTVAHKQAVGLMLNSKFGPRPPKLPLRVLITRRGLKLMDPDNNVSCCKDVQDAVAGWIGCDDGATGFTWNYAQEKAKTPSVRIEIFDARLREIGIALAQSPHFFVDARSVEEAVLTVLKNSQNMYKLGSPVEVDVLDPPSSGRFLAVVELTVDLKRLP